MKKLAAFLVVSSVLLLSNHCLAAAFLPAEVHEHEAMAADHHEAHETPAHHGDHSHSDDSGPCCTTLSEDVPAILLASPTIVRPATAYDSLVLIALPFLDLPAGAEKHFHYTTGPPGSYSGTIFLSRLSPRAPPSFASL